MFSSLRSRIFALVLLATIPCLALVLHTNQVMRNQAAEGAKSEALRVTRLVSADQQEVVRSAGEVLKVLSLIPALRTADWGVCSALFARLLPESPRYANFGVIALDGQLVCSGLPFNAPVDLSDRAYFQGALLNRDLAVGDFQIGRVTGVSSLNFGYPLLNERDQLQGVIFLALDLAWINRLAAEAQLPPGSTMTLIDSQGTILARFPDPDPWVGKSFPDEPLIRTVLESEEGTAERAGIDGVERLYAFAEIPIAMKDLHIAVGIPSGLAFADANRLLARNLIWLGLVLVVSTGAFWTFGDRLILRPVQALLRTARHLAEGDLGARTGLPITSGELGELAESFDQMAAALGRREMVQNQAEAKLRQNEEQLRLITNSLPVLISYVDREQHYQFNNEAYKSWYGIGPEEARGKHVREVIGEEDYQTRVSAIAQALSGTSVSFEGLSVHQQKGPREIQVTYVPHLGEQGNVRGFFALITDITKSKQAERALRESEERYRSLFSQMLDAFALYEIIFDGDGQPADYRFLEVNPAFEQLSAGIDAGEIEGRTIREILPSVGEQWIERYGQVTLTGVPARYEDFAELLDRYFDVVVYSPQKNQVATILSDITERKRSEKKIRRQLRNLRALRNIDLAITGSWHHDIPLKVVMDEVLEQLEVDAADVLLYDEQTQTLDCVARAGFESEALRFTQLRLGEGQAGRVALERRTVSIPDLQAEIDSFRRSQLFSEEGFKAYFAVPLIAKGQLQGVLEAFTREPLEPDQEWLDFLETLGGQAAIALDNAALFEGLQRSNMKLVRAYDSTIEGWAQALELRDMETEGHSQRVTEMTMCLARAMGISKEELVHIRRGALLHDIGKMGIPDRILHKPGPLNEEEWDTMKLHPQFAYDLLRSIDFLQPALDIPYCHHEKWDGSGYPRGLQGEQIPLPARIFAIVDVWDALRSDRPYREAWPMARVHQYLMEQAGAHFDPQVAHAFSDLLDEMEPADRQEASREVR